MPPRGSRTLFFCTRMLHQRDTVWEDNRATKGGFEKTVGYCWRTYSNLLRRIFLHGIFRALYVQRGPIWGEISDSSGFANSIRSFSRTAPRWSWPRCRAPRPGSLQASALEACSRRHQGISDHLICLREARRGHGEAHAGPGAHRAICPLGLPARRSGGGLGLAVQSG
jgi:hypothetical protein